MSARPQKSALDFSDASGLGVTIQQKCDWLDHPGFVRLAGWIREGLCYRGWYYR